MITELTPQFENRKSYYRKAFIEHQRIDMKNVYTLYSYDTLVCDLVIDIDNAGKHTLTVYNTQSNTTLRHIREFLRQHGYPKLSKNEIEQYRA